MNWKLHACTNVFSEWSIHSSVNHNLDYICCQFEIRSNSLLVLDCSTLCRLPLQCFCSLFFHNEMWSHPQPHFHNWIYHKKLKFRTLAQQLGPRWRRWDILMFPAKRWTLKEFDDLLSQIVLHNFSQYVKASYRIKRGCGVKVGLSEPTKRLYGTLSYPFYARCAVEGPNPLWFLTHQKAKLEFSPIGRWEIRRGPLLPERNLTFLVYLT